MSEEWREIPGFPGYMASTEGRVARLLSPTKYERAGYARYRVTLRRTCKSIVRSVHTLVLLAFRGSPPPGKPDGCHGDGNALNNRLDNLRWGSKLENHEDTKRHGTFKLPPKSRGPLPHIGKIPIADYSLIAERYRGGETLGSIAASYNVQTGRIYEILKKQGIVLNSKANDCRFSTGMAQ